MNPNAKGTVMSSTLPSTLSEFKLASGATGKLHSLPALEKAGFGGISRLPVSIRIVLESVLRNCDGRKVTEEHVRQLANWGATAERVDEIPFVVARVVLQDFTGVPLLADLAAMRNVAMDLGRNPKIIEPLVPVDLVVDHSVMIDHYGSKDALDLNMKLEFKRNNERYQFMKWGMQAFDTFGVVPPGIGIVHQVNLEYLARGVHEKNGVYYPDSLVGTDSHTTMINGIGVVGWGVGGIEAEAGMLGQPVYILTPDVVGVELKGKLNEGITATDLVLCVTEMLRGDKVVGKFVEFFGEGTAVAGRARPRHHRQHGARVRRDHGLLPGRPSDGRLPDLHRPHRGGGRRLHRLFQGAGTVRHSARRRHRLHEGPDPRPGVDQAVGRRPEAAAGPDRTRQASSRRSPNSSASRSPRAALPRRRPNSRGASRRGGAPTAQARSATRRCSSRTARRRATWSRW